MSAVGVVRALGPIDWKSVRRDSLLRWMFVMPVLLAALFRYGLPPLTAWLVERHGIALAPYSALIASCLVMITPMMYGTVIGFLLLDQKDDRTLTALQVTPLTPGGYLLYRLGTPSLLSVVMTVLVLRASGLSDIGLARQLWSAIAAAPLAPAFAVFMAAFARNKVQGFALMKAAGALNWPPLIAWFVHSNWQWAFGLCPTYWPVKLYWELDAGGPNAWWILLVGIAYQSLLIAWMLRRFDRVMHR
jgi:fluoroquinolone transport system permease protein